MANTKKYVSLDKLALYDEKIKKVITDGDAASLASAKEYADGLAANYDASGAAAGVQAKLDEEVARAKAREDEIAGLVATAQGEVDALETYVGTIPEGATATDIVSYVQEKTSGIATSENLQELTNRVAQAETDIDNIEKDYLKAADKTELSEAIAAEKTRAEGIEGGLRTDVDAIKGDYLKAADKTELQGNIDTNAQAIAAVKEDVDYFFKDALNDTDVQQYKDTLKEIQDYINSDATAASEVTASIKQNADDIDALEGRMDTAEGDIEAVEGRLDTAEGEIDALQAKFGEGEGSVADMIADAVAAEKAEREAADAEVQADADKGIEDAAAALAAANAASAHADELNTAMDTRVKSLETASANHALKSEVEALAGRVTTAEGEIDTLQSEMDAVEALAAANKAAHEANAAAIALKASQADLEAVAGRVTTLETWHNNFTEASEEEINALFA